MNEPTTAPLSGEETHAILITAARHCYTDTERDLLLAAQRHDHGAALRLAGEMALFNLLDVRLDANAPARPRAAA